MLRCANYSDREKICLTASIENNSHSMYTPVYSQHLADFLAMKLSVLLLTRLALPLCLSFAVVSSTFVQPLSAATSGA
jgi:hypothetical protein